MSPDSNPVMRALSSGLSQLTMNDNNNSINKAATAPPTGRATAARLTPSLTDTEIMELVSQIVSHRKNEGTHSKDDNKTEKKPTLHISKKPLDELIKSLHSGIDWIELLKKDSAMDMEWREVCVRYEHHWITAEASTEVQTHPQRGRFTELRRSLFPIESIKEYVHELRIGHMTWEQAQQQSTDAVDTNLRRHRVADQRMRKLRGGHSKSQSGRGKGK